MISTIAANLCIGCNDTTKEPQKPFEDKTFIKSNTSISLTKIGNNNIDIFPINVTFVAELSGEKKWLDGDITFQFKSDTSIQDCSTESFPAWIGIAICQINNIEPGTTMIVSAQYSGDVKNNSSTSTPLVIQAHQIRTSLMFSEAYQIIKVGKEAHVSVKLGPFYQISSKPTGTISFYITPARNNKVVISECSAQDIDNDLLAHCTINPLSIGEYEISAKYLGDKHYVGSEASWMFGGHTIYVE